MTLYMYLVVPKFCRAVVSERSFSNAMRAFSREASFNFFSGRFHGLCSCCFEAPVGGIYVALVAGLVKKAPFVVQAKDNVLSNCHMSNPLLVPTNGTRGY